MSSALHFVHKVYVRFVAHSHEIIIPLLGEFQKQHIVTVLVLAAALLALAVQVALAKEAGQ